jgi:hypothetical protein
VLDARRRTIPPSSRIRESIANGESFGDVGDDGRLAWVENPSGLVGRLIAGVGASQIRSQANHATRVH